MSDKHVVKMLDFVADIIKGNECKCSVTRQTTMASSVYQCERCRLLAQHDDWLKQQAEYKP